MTAFGRAPARQTNKIISKANSFKPLKKHYVYHTDCCIKSFLLPHGCFFISSDVFFYFSSEASKCLRIRADGKPLTLPTEMPGVTFTVDDQCRQQYGNRAKHCHKYKVFPLPPPKEKLLLFICLVPMTVCAAGEKVVSIRKRVVRRGSAVYSSHCRTPFIVSIAQPRVQARTSSAPVYLSPKCKLGYFKLQLITAMRGNNIIGNT